jgi:AcrR family transcriptional regulator
MATSPGRRYLSKLRQQQADETRRRIADAARRLFVAAGFAGTTVEAIARAAGVATQTVYAVFGSKPGILVELLERTALDPGEALIKQFEATRDPVAKLRLASRFARQLYDAERSELELLRATGVVAPELSEMDREKGSARFDAQSSLVEDLARSGRLRPDLDVAAARDILWTFTSREFYRLFVLERGWSSDRYEAWLGRLICDALVTPQGKARAKQSRRPKP